MRLQCRPWGLCVVVVAMFLIFLALGNWQLNRAWEKQALLDRAQMASEAAPKPLPVERSDFGSLRYAPVEISGRYDTDRQFLLDNEVRNHVAGYSVLTPLIIKGRNEAVLVDRGWIPQGLTRQLLPDVGFTQVDKTIRGTAYVPFGKGFHLGGVDDGEIVWPRVIQFIDFDVLSRRLGYDLLPVIIRLSPEAANGYLRQWKMVNMGPERHLGYAFQWFALAVAMVVILAILMFRKESVDNDE